MRYCQMKWHYVWHLMIIFILSSPAMCIDSSDLKIGNRIRLTFPNNAQKITGSIISIEGDGLKMMQDGQSHVQRVVTFSDVKQIERSLGTSKYIGTFTVIGGLIGLSGYTLSKYKEVEGQEGVPKEDKKYEIMDWDNKQAGYFTLGGITTGFLIGLIFPGKENWEKVELMQFGLDIDMNLGHSGIAMLELKIKF